MFIAKLGRNCMQGFLKACHPQRRSTIIAAAKIKEYNMLQYKKDCPTLFIFWRSNTCLSFCLCIYYVKIFVETVFKIKSMHISYIRYKCPQSRDLQQQQQQQQQHVSLTCKKRKQTPAKKLNVCDTQL